MSEHQMTVNLDNRIFADIIQSDTDVTDVLVTKCFGGSPLFEDNEKKNIFRPGSGESAEYTFCRLTENIYDSFTGNSACLELLYLTEAIIPRENDSGGNISDFKNKLYSSPMYIEYLTLNKIERGLIEGPVVNIKDIEWDAPNISNVYFKQPDIMLYNGKYILPRDIPPYLLLEIFHIFAEKYHSRLVCYNSFTETEALPGNFINTALYNYRRDLLYVNFGVNFISMDNSDCLLYNDTKVLLYLSDSRKQYVIPVFPE
ncbi:MAG: hypothetical protein LUD81_00575, partial [Clostridiales bacterium]|nr:hypothetical protein [Clostridiales bacterium]